MKPAVATNRSIRALSVTFAVLAASSLAACGSYSTRGAGDAFVGTWSCPSLPAAMQTLVITENLDNSLSLDGTGGGGDAGSDLCATDAWSYSGSTVVMQNETSCIGGTSGQQVVTVKSFKMTVNGSSLIVNATETLSGPGSTTQNLTLASACAKQ